MNGDHAASDDAPALKRSLSLPLLVCYGLGTILGAGIYVLIGEVTRAAGSFAPMAFVVAGVLATFTAFSYAELSARFPVCAGEAHYVQQALGRRWLSALTGYLVILISVISSATISNGFAGYFALFIDLPDWLTVSVLVLTLGLIASWGITESVTLAAAITLVEIGGLLLVVYLGRGGLSELPQQLDSWQQEFSTATVSATFAGAFLAFYAFIGFEDMVNVAEEVKQPERNMPLGIVIALLLSTALYLLVALTAVLSLPLERVAGSRSPLADIVEFHQPGLVPTIAVISMVAVVNGALIQIIKGSRVIYGMARNRMAPAPLARVHGRTRTPILATALCAVLVAAFALSLDLVALARLTSFLTLLVFALVNLVLLVIKLRHSPEYQGFRVPLPMPLAGLLCCAGAILHELSLMWA